MKLTQTWSRLFSTSPKKGPMSTEFKAFFRLRVQDRPIRLGSKVKEVYRTSKTVGRLIYSMKYIVGKT